MSDYDKWHTIVEVQSSTDIEGAPPQIYTYRLSVPGGWVYRTENGLCYVPDLEEWGDVLHNILKGLAEDIEVKVKS
jgi:hypothetical protein